MVSCTEVAKLIQANSGDIVAYGYTYDRNTVEIEYDDGMFFRFVYDKYPESCIEQACISGNFECNIFFRDVKRWYKNKTNALLVDLFEQFGHPLQITP